MATRTDPQPRPRRIWQWGDVRQRKLGMFAYILNRLSGLGLTLYLFLHMVVLSMLAQGPAGWDPFIEIVKAPWFLLLDVVLLFGLLIHGLNGLRVTLNGFGIGVRAQKPLFLVLMAIAAVAGVVGTWSIFTK